MISLFFLTWYIIYLSSVHISLYLQQIKNKLRKNIGFADNNSSHQYIYIIYVPFRFVKIGKTKNIHKRLQAHRTALAYLRILAIIPVQEIDQTEIVIRNLFHQYKYSFFHEIFTLHWSMFLLCWYLSDDALTKRYKQIMNKKTI